jgi:hypothetical protein
MAADPSRLRRTTVEQKRTESEKATRTYEAPRVEDLGTMASLLKTKATKRVNIRLAAEDVEKT